MRRGGGLPGVTHIVILELAVAAVVLAAIAGDLPALALVSAAALVLVLTIFGRADGRWIYEWVVARSRLRRRRATTSRLKSRLATSPPAVVALASLAPRLTIRAVPDRGRTVGVGQDREGWFAAVALGTWDDVWGQRDVRLELERLSRLLDESVMPVSSLQVLTYQTVTPSAFVDDTAAARSYRELLGSEGCPVEQAVWLSVRLSPADAAEAAATRGGGMEGVDRAMAATVGRIEKILASAGIANQALDADGLREAMSFCAGLESLPPTGGNNNLPRERWSSWSVGGMTHACFTVTHWAQDPSADLVRQLAQVPGFGVAVAMILRPYGERAGLLGLVRVSAPSDRLRVAVRQLNRVAGRLGLRLRRLDGEHGPGVYATTPTGGGDARAMTAASWRAAPKEGLRRLFAAAGPAGVIVGRDHPGAVAPVRLLRPQPTRVALVGGYWAARLVVLRSLAAGAMVEVITADPIRWAGLAEGAGAGSRFRITRTGELAPPLVPLGSARPVVQVNDGGRSMERPDLGAWHTSMTIVTTLTSNTAAALADANVVLLQRLTPQEADACVAALRLPPDASTKLQQIHDDMVVAVVAGDMHFLWFATTSVEGDLLGPARRDTT
jgi:type VII secretion protein EccE